jgi:Zn-dependent peptidase ImmA (M78 family)
MLHKSYEVDIGLRSPAIEEWCDQFAAALLLPEDQLRGDLGSQTGLDLLQILVAGPQRYMVSQQAYLIRVAKLFTVSTYDIDVTDIGVAVRAEYPSRLMTRGWLASVKEAVVRTVRTKHGSNRFVEISTDLNVSIFGMLRRKVGTQEQWLAGACPVRATIGSVSS